jgi:hypothetical protein
VFALRREIKDDKEAELERKKTINQERKVREAEKIRLQEMAARVRISPLSSSFRPFLTPYLSLHLIDEREEAAAVRLPSFPPFSCCAF